jgi:hypothetical protein
MDRFYIEKAGRGWFLWRRCKDESETLVATFHPQSQHKLDRRDEVMARRYCEQLNQVDNAE